MVVMGHWRGNLKLIITLVAAGFPYVYVRFSSTQLDSSIGDEGTKVVPVPRLEPSCIGAALMCIQIS